MQPTLTVIIPVRDDAQGLARCLEHLAVATGDLEVECLLALNAASSAVRSVAARNVRFCRVVELGDVTPYAARNAAAQQSRSPVLAFLDADTSPAADWVAAGLAAVKDHPVVAGAVSQELSLSPSVWERYDAVMHLDQRANAAEGFSATANTWVTRETWEAVGPFRESLLSGGDLEWGRRATALGFAPTYRDDVRVLHRTRKSARELARTHARMARGWFELAERPRAWQTPALRTGLTWVNERAGLPAGDRTLAKAHRLAMAARWWGWFAASRAQRSTSARRAPR